MPELNLPHRKGGHCGSSALRDLLEYNALSYSPRAPISEGMVFGVAGALAFAFADDVVAPDNPDIEIPFYMNGRSEGLESDACANLGIALDRRQTEDPELGWAWVREEIDAGRPTMVWANMKALDYQRVRMDNTHHDVVISGYDLAAGTARVADHDFEPIQTTSLASLARARSAVAFPGAPRHTTWVTRFPERLPPLRSAVEAGLRNAVATMRTADTRIWSAFDGALAHPYHQGLRGVETLARSYAGWPERYGDRLKRVMKLLYVLIERAGTGGAYYRAFHARFLAEAAELLDDARLRAAAATYGELVDAYRTLAETVRVRADGDAVEAHRAGVRHLNRVRALEEAGVARMEAWLGTGAEPVAA